MRVPKHLASSAVDSEMPDDQIMFTMNTKMNLSTDVILPSPKKGVRASLASASLSLMSSARQTVTKGVIKKRSSATL
jgi:hypothetical protein